MEFSKSLPTRSTGPAQDLASRERAPGLGIFLGLLVMLQVSQVLLYPPGSNVSPYYWVTGVLRPTLYAGVTLQTWVFMALAAVCAIGVARMPGYSEGLRIGWIGAGLFVLTLPALINTISLGRTADGLGKLILPVLVYVYLAPRTRGSGASALRGCITFVNIFSVAQVLMSKLLTGSFSANRYYLELREEYFGYYHHPFALAGVLSVCSILALHEILNGRRRPLNLVLLVCNLWLIYESQVRTYAVALGIALLVAAVGALIAARRAQHLWILGLAVVAVLPWIPSLSVGASRVTDDVSSGRLERWTQNLDVYAGQNWISRILFGGGPGAILDVNQELFERAVSSLNLFIDLMVDYGLLGLLAFLGVWVHIHRHAHARHQGPHAVALGVFLVSGAFLTNTFEFPAVTILYATALAAIACDPPQEVSP